MAGISASKLFFIMTIALGILLAIICIGVHHLNEFVNPTVYNVAYAFPVIGLILLVVVIVLYIMLFFTCQDRTRIFLIIITIITGLALLMFSIATGVNMEPFRAQINAWLMAVVWMSLLAFGMSIALIFLQEE